MQGLGFCLLIVQNSGEKWDAFASRVHLTKLVIHSGFFFSLLCILIYLLSLISVLQCMIFLSFGMEGAGG
jgi:hypothetical protein